MCKSWDFFSLNTLKVSTILYFRYGRGWRPASGNNLPQLSGGILVASLDFNLFSFLISVSN